MLSSKSVSKETPFALNNALRATMLCLIDSKFKMKIKTFFIVIKQEIQSLK
jgi:hypothetical protein